MTTFSFEIVRIRGLHEHVQFTVVHTSVVKSTKYPVSVSSAVTEAIGFISIPTSIHKYPSSVSCRVPTLPNTVPAHITPNETQRVATKHVFHQTPLSEMMSATISSQWNVLRQMLVPSAQRTKTMLTNVTRDQSSRVVQAQSVSVHGLQPMRVVLQRYRSYHLSSRCCGIFSDFQTATRSSSAFRIDGSPGPRATSAFVAC